MEQREKEMHLLRQKAENCLKEPATYFRPLRERNTCQFYVFGIHPRFLQIDPGSFTSRLVLELHGIIQQL
jgi:hypothetical protein